MDVFVRGRTIKDVLEENRYNAPGFDFLRLLLSVLILLYHCYLLGSVRDERNFMPANDGINGMSALTPHQLMLHFMHPFTIFLVGAFFCLSGFLVSGSALRNRSVGKFLSLRVFRILPALLTEVTLSALVLGPFVTNWELKAYFSNRQFWAYFGNIIGHITYYLPGVFEGNPATNVVNGNLWTLPPEFYCYLILSLAMVLGIFYSKKMLNIMFAVYSIAMLVLTYKYGLELRSVSSHFSTSFIVYIFFIGCVFYRNAETIILDYRVFITASLGYYITIVIGNLDFFAAFLLAYIVVYIGMCRLPISRLVKGDYSYGVYLYGFPITQAVVYFTHPFLQQYGRIIGLIPITVLSVLLTLLIASFSWHAIEKPTLRLRRFISRQNQTSVTPASA